MLRKLVNEVYNTTYNDEKDCWKKIVDLLLEEKRFKVKMQIHRIFIFFVKRGRYPKFIEILTYGGGKP